MTTYSGLLSDYLGRGLHAARPVTPPVVNPGVSVSWYSTDTHTLSEWDGSVWTDITGGGGGGSAPWWFAPSSAASFPTVVYNAAGGTPAPTIVDDTDLGTVATFQNLTGGGTMAGIFKPRTFTGDWSLDAHLSVLSNPGNYASAGLCIRDSVTGHCTTFGPFSDGSGQTPTAIASTQWAFDNAGSSYNSHNFREYGHVTSTNSDLFLRLKFTLSTGFIEFLISADGKNFRSMFGSGILYTTWTAAPNQIGFYHQNQFSSTPDNNQFVTCGRWIMVG